MNITAHLPPPADKIMEDFIDKVCLIEPKFVDGIYLTGSLSLNDFYPNKSDIDFLVLCKNLPDKKTTAQLRKIHKTIALHYAKPDLSGSYLASASFPTDRPDLIKTLTYHEGVLRYAIFEMAPISLLELKSNAITVLGQNAETLPVYIDKDYVNNFLNDNINSYWTKWLKQYSSFFKRKLLLLLFPRLTEWSVLGVARQLCTLQTGRIVSKTEAGLYCMQQLPERFHSVLKDAVKIRKDNRTYPVVRSYAIRPSFKRQAQTIECVNYMIKTFNNTYGQSR